jgi:hypothetical protein
MAYLTKAQHRLSVTPITLCRNKRTRWPAHLLRRSTRGIGKKIFNCSGNVNRPPRAAPAAAAPWTVARSEIWRPRRYSNGGARYHTDTAPSLADGGREFYNSG